MKTTCAFLAALLPAAVFAAAEPMPVRNPFWPIGYEGERAVITAEPRVKVAIPSVSSVGDDTQTAADAVAMAVAATAETATPQHWAAARKTLAVGSPLVLAGPDGMRRSSVMIVTHSGRRFTWKVIGLNDSDVLKLVRIRAKKVEDPEQDPRKGTSK